MSYKDMFLGDFIEMVKEWIGIDKYKEMEKELQLSNIILNNKGVQDYKDKVWKYLIKIGEVIF